VHWIFRARKSHLVLPSREASALLLSPEHVKNNDFGSAQARPNPSNPSQREDSVVPNPGERLGDDYDTTRATDGSVVNESGTDAAVEHGEFVADTIAEKEKVLEFMNAWWCQHWESADTSDRDSYVLASWRPRCAKRTVSAKYASALEPSSSSSCRRAAAFRRVRLPACAKRCRRRPRR
jgi:hypothetical protein